VRGAQEWGVRLAPVSASGTGFGAGEASAWRRCPCRSGNWSLCAWRPSE